MRQRQAHHGVQPQHAPALAPVGQGDAAAQRLHDHLARINTSIDNVRDTISTAIQVNLSMVAIEESEDNKKLAAWAGIFAVATAFAGIWGMNFRAMPELDWEYGYPVALSVITLTSVLLYRRFKRAGWL